MSALTLAEFIRIADGLYPPARAESWDAVGLVCGDPAAEVRRILFAVDPVQEVVDEAVACGADLLVTHHPLYLRGTTSVHAGTFKGRVVHELIRAGIGLFTAHTNADSADPGVSDALARALGLRVTGPLVPAPDDPAGRRGTGRIGELPEPEPFREFAARAARALPATAGGVRAAGDPELAVRTVAVCGGSGDAFFGAARASGADVYLTADLRHHPASEAVQAGPPALLDAAHWATEWPWLRQAAEELAAAAAAQGAEVETLVSERVTDPWSAQFPMAAQPAR